MNDFLIVQIYNNNINISNVSNLTVEIKAASCLPVCKLRPAHTPAKIQLAGLYVFIYFHHM